MKGMAAAFGSRRRYEARAAAGAARPRAAGEGRRPGLDRDARPPRAAQGDVPRLVAAPRRRGRHRPRDDAVGRRRDVSSAKADILARVRSALGPAPAVPESRATTAPPARSPRDGIVDLFCETRRRVPRDRPPRRGRRPRRDRPRDPRRRRTRRRPARLRRPRPRRSIDDDALSVAELDALDAVVTGSALAIADTGTIVLDSGPGVRPPRAHARARPPRLHRRAPATIVPSVPDAVAALPRPPPRAARSRSSPARRPPPTSSSTASRASTARACST